MDYEKKLALAKEALDSGSYDKETIEYIFPELKESEGERIRKALISFLKSPFVNESITDEKVTPWIAWLEAQAEQKPQGKSALEAAKEEKVDNQNCVKPAEEYNIAGIGSKHAQGKLGEMIMNLKPVNEVLEQNPAELNDDDKQYLLVCKNALYKYQMSDKWDANIIYQWLESKVKSSVQQPKQEWSKEDESLRLRTIGALVTCKIGSPTKCVDEQINWLKSLKPQSQWKPSDEQVSVLEFVMNDIEKDSLRYAILNSVLEQLKKLKG